MTTQTALYVNGVINVAFITLLVTGLVQYTKWLIELKIPVSKTYHDEAIQLYVLLLTVAGVLIATYLGPEGFHNGRDVLLAAVYTLADFFASQGLYQKLRGPYPVTPPVAPPPPASVVQSVLTRYAPGSLPQQQTSTLPAPMSPETLRPARSRAVKVHGSGAIPDPREMPPASEQLPEKR